VEHEQFYYDMLEKSGSMDSYHRAFFYVMGIAGEMRCNIQTLFDFNVILTERSARNFNAVNPHRYRLTALFEARLEGLKPPASSLGVEP